MRGRRDGPRGKHFVLSICLMLAALLLVCIYYGSFWKAILQRRTTTTHTQYVGDMTSSGLGRESADDEAITEVGSEQLKGGITAAITKDKMNPVGNAGHENVFDVTIKSFPTCDRRLSELIPCLDRQVEKQLKLTLNFTLMEHYERHCPPPHRRLNCLVPYPANYKVPIQWPVSRDEVWQSNVPHTYLAMQKSDQHWMTIKGDKVIFPGGGTHFHKGAKKYIAFLAKMLGYNDNLSNNGKLRTLLDVGCGVASFGAYLLPLNILAMSIAPNDVHENQIQFALERGIPSILGVLGTRRLPFPSKSFDMAHCSRCLIDWLQRDGILLLEVDRLLRPGGTFAWSSPPSYREDKKDVQTWNDMSDLVRRMCWKVAAKEGQTVIWRKPLSDSCYRNRPEGTVPPLCDADEDPDDGWDVPMKACISRLFRGKDDAEGHALEAWPKRLMALSVRLNESTASKELFQKDYNVWRYRVEFYWNEMSSEINKNTFRNVMDMNAHFGGFAAALIDKPVWVMNVVPPSGPNTLKIIYDRGLLGTVHNWCESFSTYPRTYDLLHAWKVFSEIENQGCSSMEDLLLEMDRIVRPMGFVIIRDKGLLIDQISIHLMALHWNSWSKVVGAESDDLSIENDKILFARKQLWIPDDDNS